MAADVLIIGAGVSGLATAQALLEQGLRVTVLEQGTVGRESSWAGGGILSPLCPWDYPEEVTRLACRGMAQFGAWAAALHEATDIDPEYTRSGMLVLPPFDGATAQRWCAQHGFALQTVRACDTLPGVAGEALLLPEIAQARNPRVLQALRRRVEMLGGCIVENCPVTGLRVLHDKVQAVQTVQGEYAAERIVCTAGAWSTQVLGEYALKLEIKPIRGQMLLFKFDAPPLQHIVLQNGLYLIPRRDGHLLVGSTLEDAGFDKSTSEAVREQLIQRAGRLLPSLQTMPVMQHWAGLRPGSPGNIPTIGRHPALENLYLNSGHFRYGVTMATASVEVLLNILFDRPQPFDILPYQTGWRGAQ